MKLIESRMKLTLFLGFSAHRNDLENILPGFLIGFIYVMSNPAAGLATTLFKVAAIARFIHTFVYAIKPMPQPSRALSFFVYYAIVVYMGVSTMLTI